jgi:O-antigen/teichoic acid export membrane protein
MRLGRTVLAYLPVNLANVLVSFGTIVVLTRLLTPEEFGRYAIAMITMQFMHMGAFTWMEAAMARFQARAEREDNVAGHLRTLYTMGASVGLISLIVILSLLYVLPLSTPMKTVLAFALSSTCLQVLFNLGMEAHKAAHRIKRYSIAYSGMTVFSFALGMALVVLTPLRESGPYVGIIIGLVFGLLFDLPFMLKRQRGGKAKPEMAKTYAAYGLPICISLLLGYALNSSDVYIIAWLMGEASAGHYNAGYNLANRSLDILFIWLSMAMTPVAITAFEKHGKDRSRVIMRDYGASLIWLAMPAAVGIALVSKDAGFILGESVRDQAITVMPFIAFSGLINGLITYYVQRAFMFSGETKEFIWVMVPPVLLNIALNIILIPKFGLMGAVVATLLGYSLAFVLAVLLARRHYPLPWPLRASAEVAFACAVMAVVVMALPLGRFTPGFFTLMVKATVGGLAYLLTCWAVNAADCRTFIRGIIGRFRSRGETLEVAE